MRLRLAFTFVRLLFLAGCAASSSADDVEAADESDVTSSRVLASAFYVKPSPIDQSSLGVVVADGVAFAPGARSQALPSITGFDHQPLPKLKAVRVSVGDDSFDAIVGDTGRRPPAVFDASALRVGMKCRVLGTEMDMYSSGPPKTLTLEATIERVDDHVLAKSTKSTGGDGTLLVCDGKLAGIRAGAGSQGTYHEFKALSPEVVAAFERARS